LSVRKSRERDELEREWECKNEWLSWWVLCLGHLTSWTGVHFGGARWSLKVTFHISTRDDSIGCSIVMTDYLMVSIYWLTRTELCQGMQMNWQMVWWCWQTICQLNSE
jgi:hypothetical protein